MGEWQHDMLIIQSFGHLDELMLVRTWIEFRTGIDPRLITEIHSTTHNEFYTFCIMPHGSKTTYEPYVDHLEILGVIKAHLDTIYRVNYHHISFGAYGSYFVGNEEIGLPRWCE